MELLQKLSNTPGVSGFEDAAQNLVFEELTPHADEIWRDRLGNVIACKRARNRTSTKGRVPRLLYAAHVDEIGFMVTHIDNEGFLRFTPIGGFDARTLMSERVLVHGTRNGSHTLKGVIAPQPGWLASEADRKRVFELKELLIDLGRPAKEVFDTVQIGDVISLATTFDHLNDEVVTGRNFDDRIGVYCMVEAMKRTRNPSVDVYAVSTVQEEVGVRGIPAAASAIEADIGVAIDGSLGTDIPYAQAHERQGTLGKGTGIYLMDRLTIGSPKLVRFLIDLCVRQGIPYQRNIGGGTDASVIQRTGLGALCTTVGAPTRYMHSTVQLCHVRDIEATIALLAAFAECADELLPEDWK